MTIHSTAVIDPSAHVAPGAVIGPYTVIGPNVFVGENTQIGSHVVLEANTVLGKDCLLASGAVIGGPPQDHKFKNEFSQVIIGDRVQIREYVTVNRATGEGEKTIIGDGAMLMAYSHVAHNCVLEEGVTLANSVQVAGHVTIGEFAFISGICAIHQFVKIGRLSIIAGFSGTRQDVPPFAMTEGRPQATVVGINSIGLKRQGIGLEQRKRLKRAYHYLWFSGLNLHQSVQAVLDNIESDPLVDELLEFVQSSKRGIHQPDEGVVFDTVEVG